MGRPAIEVNGPGNTIKNVTATDSYLDFSYGDLQIQSPDSINLAVGDRSVDFFLNPNDFPIALCGERINLCMSYHTESEQMTVERMGTDTAASIDVYEMTDYQQMVAFLYLVGKVMNDGY